MNMTTPTTAEYLKHANLQMAAEAFIRDEVTGIFAIDAEEIKARLIAGNNHASRFTDSQAQAFVDQWGVVDQRANTKTGFSGTLFRNKANPNDLVLSFRSTEFIDDAARDSEATNMQEIFKFGFAFGQLADMEAWYAELTQQGEPLAGKTFSVTGYSLGGHLATAFNLMHPGAASQVVTFNGAGIGQVGDGSLGDMQAKLPQMIAEFETLRKLAVQTGLEGRLSTLEGQNAYRALKQAIAANGGIPTGAMHSLIPVLADELAFEASAELQQLGNALDAAIAVASEATRVPALTSGPDANGEITSPKGVSHAEIATKGD